MGEQAIESTTLEHFYLLNMFRNCGYPVSFIGRSMRRKIPLNHGQRENSTPEAPSDDQRTNQDSEPRWAALPYINGISEELARYLRSHNIKVAHKPTATLKTTLVKVQYTIPLDAMVDVVCQFQCKEYIFKKTPVLSKMFPIYALSI